MNSTLVLSVTLALQAAASMTVLAAPVLAPNAANAFGQDASRIGVYVGAIYAGAMLSSLLAGSQIRRTGAIRMSQIALLLAALGLGLTLSAQPAALLPGALLIGLGYGVVTPASSHILARNTPAHRMGLVFSLKQTGVPIGGAMAGLLLPPLVEFQDWRLAIEFTIALTLFAALAAQSLRGRLDDDRDPTARFDRAQVLDPLRTILNLPALRSLALASFVFAAMQLVLTGYLVTFLSHERGLTLAVAGAALAVTQIAGVAGRMFWGWSADRLIAPRRLLCLLALAMAVCSGLYALSDQHWPLALVVLISTIFGATAIGWNGVFLAEVARLVPREMAGSITGGALVVTYAGVVSGPPSFAFLITHQGYETAFVVFAVALLLLAVALARPLPALHPHNT